MAHGNLELHKPDNMITYCRGNIFEDDAPCIVNPVNCVGTMGKGLALDFKKQYPNMFSVYKKLCNEQELQIGRIVFYTNKSDGKVICLFPTKYHWREKSTVATIEIGIQKFIEYAPKADVSTVAFPKIGCGLGGLNFDWQVKPLLEKYFAEAPFDVRVYI